MEANKKSPKQTLFPQCSPSKSAEDEKKKRVAPLLTLYIALTHSEGVSARERQIERGRGRERERARENEKESEQGQERRDGRKSAEDTKTQMHVQMFVI